MLASSKGDQTWYWCGISCTLIIGVKLCFFYRAVLYNMFLVDWATRLFIVVATVTDFPTETM